MQNCKVVYLSILLSYILIEGQTCFCVMITIQAQ